MVNIVQLRPTDAASALERLTDACRALADARDFDAVKELRDRAESVRHFLKEQKHGVEAQNIAAELKLRAERRLGELLEPPDGKDRRGGKSNSHGGSSTPLPDGVSHNQSHRWHRLAASNSQMRYVFDGVSDFARWLHLAGGKYPDPAPPTIF